MRKDYLKQTPMTYEEIKEQEKKAFRGYGYLICLALGFILGCVINCKGDKTVTKTITGTLHDTITVTHTQIVPKEKTVVKYVPYEKLKTDTLQVAGETIYIKPIDTLRTQAFSKTYEDKHLKLTMSGIVTGEVNDIKADYEIKPIEIKKRSRFGLGVTVGYDIYGKPNLTGGLSYQLINF